MDFVVLGDGVMDRCPWNGNRYEPRQLLGFGPCDWSFRFFMAKSLSNDLQHTGISASGKGS